MKRYFLSIIVLMLLVLVACNDEDVSKGKDEDPVVDEENQENDEEPVVDDVESNDNAEQNEDGTVEEEETVEEEGLSEDEMMEIAKEIIIKLDNIIMLESEEEFMEVANELLVDADFYGDPSLMDSNLEEVNTSFDNEEITVYSQEHFVLFTNLSSEFIYKDGESKVEVLDVNFDFIMTDEEKYKIRLIELAQ